MKLETLKFSSEVICLTGVRLTNILDTRVLFECKPEAIPFVCKSAFNHGLYITIYSQNDEYYEMSAIRTDL